VAWTIESILFAEHERSSVASIKFRGDKSFDNSNSIFLGHRLSKAQNDKICYKFMGGMVPLAPLATPMHESSHGQVVVHLLSWNPPPQPWTFRDSLTFFVHSEVQAGVEDLYTLLNVF